MTIGGLASAQVRFKSGADGLAVQMDRATLQQELGRLSAGPDQSRVLLQLNRPLTLEEKAKLEAAGVKLGTYVGDNAYFATMREGAINIADAATVTALKSVEPIKRDWKLHTQFLMNLVPEWAVVDPGQPAGGLGEEGAKADPIIGVYILLHPDVPLNDAALNRVAKHGGVVRDRIRSLNGLVVEMPMSAVSALAAESDVLYIEPALPKLAEFNDSNRMITGADVVQAAPYGLDGAGVHVLVYDGGRARATHQDFGGRLTAHDTSSLSDHATHVAGTVGGSGVASGGVRKGMAPGVTISSFGFQYDGSGTFLYNNPGDLEADYTQAINEFGADISNNSIGTNTAANGFPCAIEGDYSVTDALIDAIVRGSLGQPMRIIWANGNERGNGRCGTQYRTTAPPSCAKNSISVGALNSNNDTVTTFTSWGPTDDGRLKPDVSAPGCQSGSDGGVTSAGSASDTAYTAKCGTSMASPTMCGLSALFLQDYRIHYSGDPDPRNSTLKAIFAHTAVDLFNPGPDYQTGYGSVRIEPAIELMREGNFLENTVNQGGAYSVFVVVQPGDPAFKATLCWDDPAAAVLSSVNLVNNLDLVVTDPSNTRRYPWTLNPSSPANPAVRTQVDNVNNTEQVYVENPQPGVWRVDVVGTNVPVGPQPFSLAASPFLVNCSSAGVARISQDRLPCNATVNLRVVDCDLNADDAVAETINVVVTSTTDTGGEMITLVETGPQTATFDAQVVVNAAGGSGVVQVANGDTLTLTYIDADNGMGGTGVLVTSTATIDCVPAVVSSVVVSNILPRSARITFTTDEPATSVVRIGSGCGSLPTTIPGGTMTTTHTVNLTALTDNTTYYFGVSTVDSAGNAGFDDAGGACYSFTTPEVPDFFTEQFSSNDNDLDNRTFIFTPAANVDQYTACSFPIITLPTDPAGGTTLTFANDDSSVNVPLTGGAQVRLYGVAYSSVYVGANGYITFTAPDTDSTESLADHFDTPRVSALFDDLDPPQQGQVSYKQLADRLVVSFINVTEDITTSNSNTFQFELYFDGRIVISYLAIAAPDGLAGLSAGLGLSPDFLENDLSTFGACGPRPPTAASLSFGTPRNIEADVELVAADDGLPSGTLAYRIETLPAHGRLFNADGAQITSAPAVLANGSSSLSYRPHFNYTGPDAFTYSVSDGGTPPDGGDSNTADVDITVGVPELVYEFNFNTNPGWTMDAGWGFGQPTGQGSHNRDPASGFTGTNVYGYNLLGDYTNNLNPTRYLRTSAIDCSTLTDTTLKFQRWLGIESSTYDKATIEVSSNGTTWTMVWQHSGPAINEAAWGLQSYDISAIADGQATVFLRWSLGPTDGSVTYPGWNIDDVQIFGVTPAPSGAGPDLDGDGQVGASDLAGLLGSWGACPSAGPCPADFDGDGVVGASDLAALLGSWGPFPPV